MLSVVTPIVPFCIILGFKNFFCFFIDKKNARYRVSDILTVCIVNMTSCHSLVVKEDSQCSSIF